MYPKSTVRLDRILSLVPPAAPGVLHTEFYTSVIHLVPTGDLTATEFQVNPIQTDDMHLLGATAGSKALSNKDDRQK